MITLFYILFALCIIPEMLNFVSPQYYKPWLEEMKDEDKETKGSTLFAVFILLVTQISYMVLTIIGLFTHQWELFLALLSLSLISSIIVKKESKPNWYTRLDSAISIAIIVSIIVNR